MLLGAHQSISGGLWRAVERAEEDGCAAVQIFTKAPQMWREPEYAEIKKENRKRILDEHQSPTNYIDILSIVEHPAFFAFYDELMKGHYAEEDEEDEGKTTGVGDMLTVPLRQDYERYDFAFPIVLRDAEEVIREREFSIEDMRPCPLPLWARAS